MNVSRVDMKSVLHNRALGTNAKRRLYEGVVVRASESNRLDVFERKYLRSMARVPRLDRVRNEEVRQRAEIVRKMSERVD